MIDYLLDPTIATALLSVVSIVATWIIRRLRWHWAQRVLMAMGTAAKLAVLETARQYTEAIKLARADGTLTAEERKEARATAWRVFSYSFSLPELARALKILDQPGTPESHGRAAIELAHHGLQSLGVIPRSVVADPRTARPLTSV